MPKKQEIEFRIAPDGKVQFTIKGVKGPACEDLAAAFEKLGEVESREKTSEYYEREGETRLHVRRGQ